MSTESKISYSVCPHRRWQINTLDTHYECCYCGEVLPKGEPETEAIEHYTGSSGENKKLSTGNVKG